jgi:hypothetical protein
MTLKLPKHVSDFFNRAAPGKKDAPLEQLHRRLDEGAETLRRASITGNAMPPHGSPDYLVEFRIREWMMREQKEREEERRMKQLHERLTHKPGKPPLGPPN